MNFIRWNERPLPDCGVLLTGGTPSRSEPSLWGGQLPWISAKSLKQFDVVDSDERLSDAGANASTVVPPGSVLFVVRGMSLAKEFRVGVSRTTVAFNQDLRALVPAKGVDGRYLARFLKASSQKILSLVDEASHGTKRLTSDRFENINVPVPPLPIQRRIAEILDKAEALRAKRRAALDQLDTLTQSIFLDMFGEPATILHRWPHGNLGPLLEFLTSGSRGWAKYYSKDGDLFLRIQNVRRDELVLDDIAYVRAPNTAEAKRTQVEPGDVLLSITADLGRTAVVPEGIQRAFINQHLAILRTKSLVPRFLSTYLASPVAQRQLSGLDRHGVKAGLNFEDIRSLLVPLPPVGLQREFQERVTAAETLYRTHELSAAKLDALFDALQHRAFRGELRL